MSLRKAIDNIILQIYRNEIEDLHNNYSRELESIKKLTKEINNPVYREKEFQYRKKKLERVYKNFDFEQIKKDIYDIAKGRKDRNFFPWRIYFGDIFKKGGFDTIIGNPPYIKEYTNKSAFNFLHNHPIYKGKMDLWYFFGWLGLDICKKEIGNVAYIATNNWNTSSGASKFRNYILNHGKFVNYINFGDYKVFKTAGIQTMIYIMKSSRDNLNYTFSCHNLLNEKLNSEDIKLFLNRVKDCRFEYYETNIIKNQCYDKFIQFNKKEINYILNAIKEKGSYYFDTSEVKCGIDVHQDYVNKKSLSTLGDSFNIGDGIFNLSDKELLQLDLSIKEKRLIKPFYTKNELGRYVADRKNKYWVIYTTSKFKNEKSMDDYPRLKTHLDKFQSVITSNNKPYGLHCARQEKIFNGEKILSLRKCPKNPTFTYTDFPTYVSQTYYVIQTSRISLKFLTCLLNSKVIKFWLRYNGKMQGSHFQIDKQPLLEIPIRIPPSTEIYERHYDNIASLTIEYTKIKSDILNSIYSRFETKTLRKIDHFDFKDHDELFRILNDKFKLCVAQDESQWKDNINYHLKKLGIVYKKIIATEKLIENEVLSLYQLDKTELREFITNCNS